MVNTQNSEKNVMHPYDSGKGKEFEEGKLSLEDLRQYAIENGEPETRSGRQEYLENLVNRFI